LFAIVTHQHFFCSAAKNNLNEHHPMNRTLSRSLSSRTLTRTPSSKAATNAVQLMIVMQLMRELAKRTRGAAARNRTRVAGRPGPNHAQLRAAARRRR
jgi:hypothetical protein